MLVFLLFYILVIPLCVLLHEIGHGIGGTSTSKAHVHIYLGNRNKENKENFRLGRLHFHINWSYIGFTQWDDSHFTRRQRAFALAGGPIMSFVLAILCGWLATWVPEGNFRLLLSGTAIFNFLQFIATIIPITYPRWWGGYSGFPSDGLQLLRLLRN